MDPDVVVGASSTVPALRAVEVAAGRPVWVDLFGDLMAEAQARLGVHPDEDLGPYRDVLLRLLEAGDAFSTVSERQRWAVIGQLGLVGRLDRRARGRQRVHCVPCCVWDSRSEDGGDAAAGLPAEIGDDDVVLLWGGGFNTWCDVDTLIAGVESAMTADPRIRLIATGGAIPGHDDATFADFRDRVQRSDHAGRFTVLGGVEARRAAAIRRRADLGIVTEKRLAERELGSSGRILHWIERGLPFVCTDLSELGATLAARGLAAIYRPGDPEDLSRAILDAVADPAEARERAERARRFADERWSVAASTEPFRRWIASAVAEPAPDGPNPLSLAAAVQAQRALGETRAELAEERARFNEVRSELGRIHHSRMWKVWMFYLGIPDLFRLRRKSAERGSDRDR
jgi:glycosyltransferase involved in cell wall biosynthesis